MYNKMVQNHISSNSICHTLHSFFMLFLIFHSQFLYQICIAHAVHIRNTVTDQLIDLRVIKKSKVASSESPCCSAKHLITRLYFFEVKLGSKEMTAPLSFASSIALIVAFLHVSKIIEREPISNLSSRFPFLLMHFPIDDQTYRRPPSR